MTLLNLEEFELVLGELYDELPDSIKNRFALFVVEKNLPGENAFGYWTNMLPNAVTFVYETFKNHGDFSKDHLRRVMKHEFEHVLMGLKHSEHKHG